MTTTKTFTTGRSQAVRIPKEFRFKESEIGIKKIGNTVILFSLEDALNDFLDAPPVTKAFGNSIREARNENLFTERSYK